MGERATAAARATRRALTEPPSFSFPLVATRALDAYAAHLMPPKFTTLIAPTGYGKTVFETSLFQIYQAQRRPCFWVALDDRDVSLDRLLARLEAVFVEPSAATLHPTEAMIDGDLPVEDRIDLLLDSIRRTGSNGVLFIDNLGFCTDETLGSLIDRLIFSTPPELQIVVSSTTELRYNMARAKLEGRVREISMVDLSLTADEVADLLGPELTETVGPAGIETILRQTEGWPAAVRLCQIILSTARDPRQALTQFSGADQDLVNLLTEQVLAAFSPQELKFLTEIAHLRSFCVDLCRHATGDAESARHLDTLLRRNVFMIPLDRNRSWYRLHGLFRECLLASDAGQTAPERRKALLERAASWCEQSGQWQDAIDYAIAAGSSELAIGMLDRVAALFVRDRGDLRQYIEWIETLHQRGQQVGWEAHFWYVWALVFHRRYDYARQQNERLAARLEQTADCDEHCLSGRLRRTELLSVCLDIYTDRLTDALPQAQRWIAEKAADDPFNVATVATALTICLGASSRLVEARQILRVAQAAIHQADSEYGLGWVSAIAALLGIYEGDYHTVYQELRSARSRARNHLGDSAGIVGTLELVAAKCAVEMGLDDEARAMLASGLRKAATHGVTDTVACGFDAAIRLWGGEAEPLAELREIAAGYPPRAALMLSCYLVQRLIRLGRLDEARHEAGQIGLSADPLPDRTASPIAPELEVERSRDLFAMTQIELWVACGHLRAAEALITEESRRARRDGRSARLVELALAEAAVAVCSHNAQPASRHLVRAVSLAAKRRILRPFKDRAELIAGLVNDTKPGSWGFALEEERRFFVEICRDLPMHNSGLLDQLDQLKIDSQLLQTPTARELELLSLVEAGLSNQQLADRLSVSVATVKWHLYNLYTKLGVSSRSAALARARALNLLSR